ncbi:DUF3825 domain-containing protein [Flagellimonas lutimaris]|uniref:DUF3825 domain-containing protein n=1 Tax=Flagellimonas lutimaris TaxID=475082 RepID=UPI0039C25BA4
MKNILTLFQFAFFPQFDDKIQYLAKNLCDPEEWDFTSSPTKTNSILKNYLFHTYDKLKAESKIVFTKDNEYAAFNTGLVTKNYEDIIAFFQEYKNPSSTNKSPFFFKAFLKRSDSQILRHFSNNMPIAANYFEKPEDLIFNPKCELIADIDHIIEDNLTRFPAHLQTSTHDELKRQLFGSIDEVKKKVKTNYKIAIPQYYNGRIQLLLPLCLTAGSPNPDLALVTHKINADTYTSRTCLTLNMAYNNARLIVKPQSDWLKP